ncbi:MAG: orotidine-5'-phosphate decarboxylase [Gammaproteobacteria bacterium]|nr:orotidine-5'-phosphate decarboxylase [Gammaproteobacteria bacterium]
MLDKRHSSPVIVALDFSEQREVEEFVERLSPDSCRLKIGKELFTSVGPGLVRTLVKQDFDVFLDLKFHDIPNTVAKACAVAADMGVWMMNVHASGGRKMMEAARASIDSTGGEKPLLIAVTVLTSMAESDLVEVGLNVSPDKQVQRLAALTQQSGLDGVVCSSREVQGLHTMLGDDFLLVTPGIRPTGSDVGDQKRIMTPADAMSAGSHYLVIGRPITQAADPVEMLDSINSEIGFAR